jgi:hypothetical protein
MIPSIETSSHEMFIETDPSPVTDTSSDTDFVDMSDAMEIVDEKEQALHCDQYNEHLTDGVDRILRVQQEEAVAVCWSDCTL